MTDDDSTDELARALFEAARQRRPSEAARAATLAVMLAGDVGAGAASPRIPGTRHVIRRRLVWAALAAAVLSIAALVLRDRATTAPAISAEDVSWHAPETKPVVTSSAAEPVAPPSRAKELPRAPPRKAVRRRTEKQVTVEKRPEPVPAPSLSDEVGALDRVRSALVANDAARALRLLDDYEGVAHGGRLTAEATLLRVEVLARSGQRGSAAQLARRFIEANPGSPLAEGARAFIGGSGAEATDSGL